MWNEAYIYEKNLHFIYDNSEQLRLEDVLEHCDKSFSSPLQSMLPENITSVLPDGAGLLN